jgi:outer membrane cobalamin receptor
LTPLAAAEERKADAGGHFEFGDLRPGRYRLVANAPGFSTASAPVELAGGNTTLTRDLRLEIGAVQQQVVVSAALGGALAPEVGSSVSVVSQQEIEGRDAQSVLEVLRGVPGVDVNQTGRDGGVTGVFIRGGDSDYNLVMIDGVELNELGGAFDFSSLPADGVQQVEVIRGPESALYGPDAVTSVINIVSQRGEGPPHFSGLAEAGSFTTRRFATAGSGLTDGLGWAYDLSRLTFGGVVPNDNYRRQSAFLSLGYSRSPRREVNFHFFGDSNDAGDPGPFGSDPLGLYPGIDRISRDKENLFTYQASETEQLASHFRQVTTASIATNNEFFHTPYGDSFSDNLRAVLNTRSEVAVSSKDFLVAGFEYNREQIKDTYIADLNGEPFLLPRTSLAAFLENRWNPTRRWFVTTGLRVDDIETRALPLPAGLPATTIDKVNPRASVAYLMRDTGTASPLGSTRLHGSFGTGIRPPNGFELAFTTNPHLKPEESLSFDAGIEQRFFGDRAVIEATYFENHFKDQIVTLTGSLTNLSNWESANLARSRARGLETSFRLRPWSAFELGGEYTRDDTAILALAGSTLPPTYFQVGQPLLRRPRDSAGWNATWWHKRLMLNLNSYIRGPVLDVEPNYGISEGLFRNKGYVLANTGFSYRVHRGVEIYGRLNNFLNQKYEESFGYPALHLNFLAGIRFNIPAE